MYTAAITIGAICAAGLTALRASGAGLGHPAGDSPLGIVAFGAVFAAPPILAAIGLRPSSPTAILAAGLVSIPLSFLSFSGITLVLLPAGLFYLAGATRGPDRRTMQLLPALLATVLAVGSLVPLLGLTEEVCWVQHADGSFDTGPGAAPGPDGLESLSGSFTLGPDDRGAGCSTGRLSTHGAALALVMVGGAFAVAHRSRRGGSNMPAARPAAARLSSEGGRPSEPDRHEQP